MEETKELVNETSLNANFEFNMTNIWFIFSFYMYVLPLLYLNTYEYVPYSFEIKYNTQFNQLFITNLNYNYNMQLF